MIREKVFYCCPFYCSAGLFLRNHRSYSQQITLSEKKVIYELPYAGILPDNPLYFLKQVRDVVLEFTTRDQMKKSEMLLLSSDKKVHMAQLLSKKGKSKLVIDVLDNAEKQFMKIPKLVKSSNPREYGRRRVCVPPSTGKREAS
jgi:hypothetical protein